MSDPAPKPELLRSLGRLVRGLSALFWGLPLTLLVCVGTLQTDWLHAYTIFPALATTGLLLFGLLQIGSFQKQERPWRNAVTRAELLGLINFGLCPFLYWWNRVPEKLFFGIAVLLFAVSALLFLFSLNLVLLRLGAMLPDETLRHEIRQYTALNRNLLILLFVFIAAFLLLSRVLHAYLVQRLHLPEQADILSIQFSIPALGLQINSLWVIGLLMCLLLLLPLAMTMALIWKTKEVILENVFGANHH